METFLIMKKKVRRLRNKLKYISKIVDDIPLVVRYERPMYDIDSESFNKLANTILAACDLTDDELLS